jgi:murein DD-endopeptidase MepM/ murein hydrolase activator NlpD
MRAAMNPGGRHRGRSQRSLLDRSLLCVTAWAASGWLPLAADSLYKYRDASGQLVYSDHAPGNTPQAPVESIPYVSSEARAPTVEVRERKDQGRVSLVAVNECHCVAEYTVHLQNGSSLHAILQPQTGKALLDDTAGVAWTWRVVLGSPDAMPAPNVLYRAPFAVGSSYRITQAWPQVITHLSASDRYALDIGLPDGTPIYAAREGLVINVQHDKFLTAAAPVMLDQANMIEILHDDDTIAIYAHLQWDSVRVQPGQRVGRGDYIANSGNTGFSTGPHLHFAVSHNAGMATVSLPVVFQGPAGTAAAPQTGMMLTAY